MSDGVRVGYEGWAATYDEMVNPTRDLDAQVLRQVMEAYVGGRVLELGVARARTRSGWPSGPSD